MNPSELTTLTYSTPSKSFSPPDESWISSFISRSSEEIISSPSNAPEVAFETLVSTFTDLLKAKLNFLLSPETSSDSFCDSLNSFCGTLPQFLSSLALKNSLSISNDLEDTPQNETSPKQDTPTPSITLTFTPETEALVKENSAEDEELLIESSLYRRVLAIFRRNSRSVHDLYTAIDINKDGKITAAEVRAELFRYDQSTTLEEATEVFRILDGDKDGFVSEDDMNKRMKFIIEKSKDEETDPLSCIIISKPLDSDCIHGVVSVTLLKISGFKAGSRSIRFKLKDVLEYLTPEINENLLTFNFKADFLLENKTMTSLQTNLEVDVINKNKSEGHANFNWTKSGSIATEFSYKLKLDIKTSTGQAKGVVQLQVSWSPIFPKILSHKELLRLERLEAKALDYQSRLQIHHKATRSTGHRMTVEIQRSDDDSYLEEAKLEVTGDMLPRGMNYMINVCTKSTERLYVNKAAVPRSPGSPCGMDYLSVRSGLRNYTGGDRPKTPNVFKKTTENSLSPRGSVIKPGRKSSMQL